MFYIQTSLALDVVILGPKSSFAEIYLTCVKRIINVSLHKREEEENWMMFRNKGPPGRS